MGWRRHVWFATGLTLVGCTPDDSSRLVLEICDNGIDDDGNGDVDCLDTRCRNALTCLALAQCGDDIRSGDEFCDGTDLGGATCGSQGFLEGVGALGCRSDCAGLDTSGCLRDDLCGNGSVDGAEQCDTTDFRADSCRARGFAAGELSCTSLCQVDESGCSGVNPCGNGLVDAGELCDGDALAGQSCASFVGFTGSGLRCNPSCDGFDTSACAIELCGNGRLDPGELCDGPPENLSCDDVDPRFASGAVGCSESCDSYDTRACTTCGNNTLDEGEVCDGVALGGRDCELEGFFAGTLVCNPTCSGLDTSRCTNCGNGTIDDVEVCDGQLFREDAPTCRELGYQAGDVACASDCSSIDASACTGFFECGNGFLDGLPMPTEAVFQEMCDPTLAALNEPFGYGRTAFFPLHNTLTEGCFIYDFTPPIDDRADIICNADCTISIAACDVNNPNVLVNGDFCEELGWYNDGICDPCDRIAGTPDPDCEHPLGGPTRCGDGTANGDFALRTRGGVTLSLPGSPFDWCDGDDLRSMDCTTLGFGGGTLRCRDDCNFDTSGCTPPAYVCGDGAVSPNTREVCEPSQSCSDYDSRFTGGSFECIECLVAKTDNCIE